MGKRREDRLYGVGVSPRIQQESHMNAATFRRVYEENRGRRFHGPKEYSAYWEALRKAAAPEHVGESVSVFMSDEVHCSCGWKSEGYWDMVEAAWDDWREHVAGEMGIVSKKCPGCGKEYFPADGGHPCHKIVAVSDT